MVAEAMSKPAPVIAASATLTDLRDALQSHQSQALCVLDSEGLLGGIVTLSDLQKAYREQIENGPHTIRTVGEICSQNVITVYPDQLI